MTKPQLGAVLIAALYALGGIALILSAIMLKSIDIATYPEYSMLTGTGSVVLLLMGVVAFTIAYGVYNMTEWGWAIAIILSAVGLVGAAAALNIASMIIPAIIVAYLWTNKKDFGM